MNGPEEPDIFKNIDKKLKKLKITLDKGCVRCDEDEQG